LLNPTESVCGFAWSQWPLDRFLLNPYIADVHVTRFHVHRLEAAGRDPTVSGRYRLCHIVAGAYPPVLAKHSKGFVLIDTLAPGVDRIQRNFEPMEHQVERLRAALISDEQAQQTVLKQRKYAESSELERGRQIWLFGP
jgi:hypothetical protein